MRSLSAENLAALQARRIVARDFVWVVARDRDTGEQVADGQWSDVGTIEADVINPETGGSVTRTYHGSGTLTKLSAIPLVASVTVQTVTISMSQVNDRVEALLRQYDADQAPVQIHRGLFSPETRQLVAPAFCRFFGFVDRVEIRTPAENETGAAILTCKSHAQELSRANPDLRSHESQQLRMAGDQFFADAHVVGTWEQFWGREAGRVPATAGQQSLVR